MTDSRWWTNFMKILWYTCIKCLEFGLITRNFRESKRWFEALVQFMIEHWALFHCSRTSSSGERILSGQTLLNLPRWRNIYTRDMSSMIHPQSKTTWTFCLKRHMWKKQPSCTSRWSKILISNLKEETRSTLYGCNCVKYLPRIQKSCLMQRR